MDWRHDTMARKTAPVDTTGMSSAKRTAVLRKEAVTEWDGVLPEKYALMMPEWERYRAAVLMANAGLPKVMIAKVLGVAVKTVGDIIRYTPMSPAKLYVYHNSPEFRAEQRLWQLKVLGNCAQPPA